MHDSAIKSYRDFQNTYLDSLALKNKLHVIEIGSCSINSNIKNIVESNHRYSGLDIEKGPNVDTVLDDPYKLPYKDGSIDVVISISTFEHTEFFWLTYLEILRVLKNDGLFFLNVPSNGKFHRHSTDNWRFYPDSSLSLTKWARKNSFNPLVLEHYTNYEEGIDIWNDYVSVTIKDKNFKSKYLTRTIQKKKNFTNGRIDESLDIINYTENSQDQNNWGWKLHYKFRKKIWKLMNFIYRFIKI